MGEQAKLDTLLLMAEAKRKEGHLWRWVLVRSCDNSAIGKDEFTKLFVTKRNNNLLKIPDWHGLMEWISMSDIWICIDNVAASIQN